MKHVKKVEKQVREHWVHDYDTCDICGKRTDEYDVRNGDNASEVELEAHIGNVWPEGDFRKVFWLDVCPKCFQEKVKLILEKELNVKFHERDADDPPYEGGLKPDGSPYTHFIDDTSRPG